MDEQTALYREALFRQEKERVIVTARLKFSEIADVLERAQHANSKGRREALEYLLEEAREIAQKMAEQYENEQDNLADY